MELPAEKVHFTARVKQFALSWNHFNEANDEVIILEDLIIQKDESIEVGIGWCSHSKTLKKFELEPGESLEFDGKIVKKKLPKGKDCDEEFIIEEPVLYKVNNPSKIKKAKSVMLFSFFDYERILFSPSISCMGLMFCVNSRVPI